MLCSSTIASVCKQILRQGERELLTTALAAVVHTALACGILAQYDTVEQMFCKLNLRPTGSAEKSTCFAATISMSGQDARGRGSLAI